MSDELDSREWFESEAAVAYAETIPSSRLSWPGATSEQLAFMRRVYDLHVARSAARRPFVADVPASELGPIEGGVQARRAAAIDCVALLSAARLALAAEVAAGRLVASSRVGISSGYRSATRQFNAWQRNFPRYYAETATQRAAAAGGEHSDQAASLLARYIGARLGAPGFSLHNDGRAVDLFTVEGGRRLGASSAADNIRRWRASWFWRWLEANAARFNFYQNTSINEPWHWEHRPPTTATELFGGLDDEFEESATEADLLDDLVEDAILDHEGRIVGEAPEDELIDLNESINVTAGRVVVAHVPLLRVHAGTPPDLVLRWNDMAGAGAVDVVVHLHGYARAAARMRIDRDKEPISGLDFADPDGGGGGRRTRPTVGMLPRGNFFGGRSGRGYDFPVLARPGGLGRLIDLALEAFAHEVGVERVDRGRLIVTAHSGGGAALMRILAAGNDPDEIHVFDGLYGSAQVLVAWARRRIQRDRAAPAGAAYDPAAAGALRVLYRPGTGTQEHSLAVARALRGALAGAPASLAARYRVEATRVGHSEIPRRFGWRLLADAGADLPGAAAPRRAAELAEPDQAAEVDLAETLPGFSAAEEKALRITNAFENTGAYVRSRDLSYATLAGDFDGQGISFGLLQWNIGTGSLQPLLHAFERAHPARFAAVFGDQASAVSAMLRQSRQHQLTWARSINDYSNPRRPVVIQPWRARFASLGADPEFRAIELRAVRPRMDRAISYARAYGLRSERGLALMFDIVTQHGPAWHNRRRRRETITQRCADFERDQGRPPTEIELMRMIADVISDTITSRWRAGVRARRATIIDGRGTVHGHAFDLARDFGLGDAPW